MRILVTGGAGFIGSHLAEKLVQLGNEVIVYDNFSNGSYDNINELFNKGELTLIKGDITNTQNIHSSLKGVEGVVHLAAIVSVTESIKNPETVFDVNVGGTLRLLDACVKQRVRRFIFASSAAIYGNASPPLSETSQIKPISPYGASKAASEMFCHAYGESYDLETVVLRFMNVYGPRQTPGPYAGVISKFAQAIGKGSPLLVYGDGKQSRDFVYVSDVVDAIALSLNSKRGNHEILNVGTGNPTTVNQLAKIFRNLSGRTDYPIRHVEARKGEVRFSYADIRKARKLLRYDPKVALNEGVTKFVDWYNTHRNQKKNRN
jgi:UDP-glucose 4-epimerase